MSNRINETIRNAREQGRLAFIGLVPISPEGPQRSLEIARTMVESGVDILMVHIPNWMPWMEGGVLQRAAMNPRRAGVTRDDVFDLALMLRHQHPDVPIIDMTLYDTALTMGQDHFLDCSVRADIDGFDLPNYPLLASKDQWGLHGWCVENERHLILAISYEVATSEPGTPAHEQLEQFARLGRGFVFVMNAPGGKSGADNLLTPKQLADAVAGVKRALAEAGNDDCTVSVVCGISNASDVAAVRTSGAESFMIGSAYIKMLQDGASLDEVSAYLASIREACVLEAGEDDEAAR